MKLANILFDPEIGNTIFQPVINMSAIKKHFTDFVQTSY